MEYLLHFTSLNCKKQTNHVNFQGWTTFLSYCKVNNEDQKFETWDLHPGTWGVRWKAQRSKNMNNIAHQGDSPACPNTAGTQSLGTHSIYMHWYSILFPKLKIFVCSQLQNTQPDNHMQAQKITWDNGKTEKATKYIWNVPNSSIICLFPREIWTAFCARAVKQIIIYWEVNIAWLEAFHMSWLGTQQSLLTRRETAST